MAHPLAHLTNISCRKFTEKLRHTRLSVTTRKPLDRLSSHTRFIATYIHILGTFGK